MNNLTEKVFAIIKNTKPESKWKFKLKDQVIWLAGFLFVLIGSLAAAVVMYMIANNDWSLSSQIAPSKWQFMLQSLPIYWLLTIILLIFIAYYNFRHTSVGYRYQLLAIVLASVLASIIFGGLFYYLGFGHIIDHTFAERIPIYERFASPRRAMWISPENGRLAGKVMVIRSADFDLIDFHNNLWLIEPVMAGEFLKEGEIVRMIGQKIGDGQFRADRIMPFDMRGKFPEILGPGFMHRPF